MGLGATRPLNINIMIVFKLQVRLQFLKCIRFFRNKKAKTTSVRYSEYHCPSIPPAQHFFLPPTHAIRMIVEAAAVGSW